MESLIPVVSVEFYRQLPSERDTDHIANELKSLEFFKEAIKDIEEPLITICSKESIQERRYLLTCFYYQKEAEKIKDIIKTSIFESIVFKDVLLFFTKKELEKKTKSPADEKTVKAIVEQFDIYKKVEKQKTIEMVNKSLENNGNSPYENYSPNKERFLEAYYNWYAPLREKVSADITSYAKSNPEVIKIPSIDVLLMNDVATHFIHVEFNKIHHREPTGEEMDSLLKATEKLFIKKELMQALRSYLPESAKEKKIPILDQYVEKKTAFLDHLYGQSERCLEKIREKLHDLEALKA